mmetsp:Transcript_5792/g.18405  ORF Transcript_5792/g.18405 Transcript_5792/m.18405 type:complete len:215 (+) Transcript_5792:881-1525(+)
MPLHQTRRRRHRRRRAATAHRAHDAQVLARLGRGYGRGGAAAAKNALLGHSRRRVDVRGTAAAQRSAVRPAGLFLKVRAAREPARAGRSLLCPDEASLPAAPAGAAPDFVGRRLRGVHRHDAPPGRAPPLVGWERLGMLEFCKGKTRPQFPTSRVDRRDGRPLARHRPGSGGRRRKLRRAKRRHGLRPPRRPLRACRPPGDGGDALEARPGEYF